LRDIDGITYCNDGDWVESCTALVEAPGGELSLWQFGAATGLSQGDELLEVAA
jgi:UDP-2,3-diacylglucosamine pyrophosphatase LpxH